MTPACNQELAFRVGRTLARAVQRRENLRLRCRGAVHHVSPHWVGLHRFPDLEIGCLARAWDPTNCTDLGWAWFNLYDIEHADSLPDLNLWFTGWDDYDPPGDENDVVVCIPKSGRTR